MRGRAEEILVEGGSVRRVAKREEYSDVIARFRINNNEDKEEKEEKETQEEEDHQDEESDTEDRV